MANTLENVVPQLLAQGLLALRENARMPMLVNRGYERMAGEKGSTIDVPVPSAVEAKPVTAAATPPSATDSNPGTVSIPMDQWEEAGFYLTDKDMLEAMTGTIPMQASEAIKSLCNKVDKYILGLYKGVYGFTGQKSGGSYVTPFKKATNREGTEDVTDARKILFNQLAPPDDRRIVVDADAEANALNLRALQDYSWTGDTKAINDAKIERKLGFSWTMDQNVLTHDAGNAAGWLVNQGTATKRAIGVKEMALDGGASTDANVGDIFKFAGDTQTYVVTSWDRSGAGAATVGFAPGLVKAVADNAALTFEPDHVVNLAFHRDAFAFATRPLQSSAQGLGNLISQATDPVSKLSLRLEVSREYKRTRFSYDILFGGALVRAEFACRIAG